MEFFIWLQMENFESHNFFDVGRAFFFASFFGQVEIGVLR